MAKVSALAPLLGSEDGAEGREQRAMVIVALIGSLLAVVVLLVVATLVVSDFKVDGLGSALTAAGIATAVEYAVHAFGSAITPLLLPHVLESFWIPWIFNLVLSSVALTVGIQFTPGIRAGMLSTVRVAVVASLVVSGLMLAVSPLFTA